MGTIVEFPDRSELAEEAAAWLIRLDGDMPLSSEERVALGQWMRRSRVHREELENLAVLWGRMNVLTELAVPLGHASRPSLRVRLVRTLAAKQQPLRRVAVFATLVAA